MQYIDLAMRTNSHLTGTFDVPPDILHATLGLMDELVELSNADDIVNMQEEMGDICWFVALFANCIGHDPFNTPVPKNAQLDKMPSLLDIVHEIVSHVKKAYAYGAALDNKLLSGLLDKIILGIQLTVSELQSIDEGVGFTFADLLKQNIRKLHVRFPSKFDGAHALIRDLGAERKSLEATLQ